QRSSEPKASRALARGWAEDGKRSARRKARASAGKDFYYHRQAREHASKRRREMDRGARRHGAAVSLEEARLSGGGRRSRFKARQGSETWSRSDHREKTI